MRLIEFKETVRIDATEYVAGDRKSFAPDVAAEFIRLGWASCVETGETGERVPGAQSLRVNNIETVVS